MFLGLYLQKHTESTNAYTDVTDPSELLNVMQGYAIWNQNGNATAQFTGTLNTGTYGTANNMTRTVTGDNGGNNLVGNPYCSSIDWDAAGWTKTNMMASIYIEDDGNWGIYTTGSPPAGTGNQNNYIAPGQGFFVFVNDGAPGTGTLQMDNTVRAHSSAPFLKDSYSNYIRLMATGNDKSDYTVIHFKEEATPQFDGQYDAYKFFAYEESYPQLYSITDKNLAINALPETEMIQLGFQVGIDGVYEIQSEKISDISEVWLEDTFTETYTDLAKDSYSFNYSTSDDASRFILHFVPMSVEDDLVTSIYNIYSYDKDVYVSVPQNSKGTIQVYDMMGREIAQASISGSTNVITLSKSGYYVVKVLSDEGIATQKVFIK